MTLAACGLRWLAAVLVAALCWWAPHGPARAAEVVDLARPGMPGQPTRVEVALYLADLYAVSAEDMTVVADVILRAQWLDPRLAGRSADVQGAALSDVWNPGLQVVNRRELTPLLPERVSIDPTGLVTYRQRWVGRFAVPMDLREFPFDEQRFHIQVVSLGHARDEVELAVATAQLPATRAERLAIGDWEIGAAVLSVADYEVAPGATAHAGVQLEWQGRRYLEYHVVQVLLPLVLIVLMGWTALWLEPGLTTPRVSVAMTTMLTLIAYRFALDRAVPELDYLTRFDRFMLAAMVLVFLLAMVVAYGGYLIGTGRADRVQRLDRVARAAYPVLFALAGGVTLLA